MTAVLVTRPAGYGDPLVTELEGRGYRVSAVPTLATQPLRVEWPEIGTFDWVVVTSVAGVESIPSISRGPRWAAVGDVTAGALAARGIVADFTPSEANGAALGDGLPDAAGARVLVVRGSLAAPELPARLRERGAEVVEVTAYATVEGPPEHERRLRAALQERDLAAVVFASGSAVRGFTRLGGSTALPAVTIGPRTTAVAREQGFTVVVESAGAGVKALAAAVARAAPAVSTPSAERPRRLRTSVAMRNMVRETRVDPAQLIAPLFVIGGHGRRDEIRSLRGHHRVTPDLALEEAHRLARFGVGGVLLFGIPEVKDADGSGAADPAGPVPEALRLLRAEGLPLVLAADVCLCEYTSHGHCGILAGDSVDNDATLPRLATAAVAYAEAGADVVGPSAMMDGQVGALRTALDHAGFSEAAIMAYASKHASVFYGPFREAAGSTPSFGDRKSYQMDPANRREAMREMELDAREGADILMVKPAMTSLDLLARARERFELPLAAYQVSGEAAMIEAAAEKGWVDRRGAILESLTAIARAGAGIVITYFAADAAQWMREAR